MSEQKPITLGLSPGERLSLLAAGISKSIKAQLERGDETGSYRISLSVDEADELRSAIIQEINRVGFGQTYELTKRGKILETIADRLYRLVS